MGLTEEEQAALDSLFEPDPQVVLVSAGRYAITLTIEDHSEELIELDASALANQLRELADAIEETP